jgi:hypothetical protein
VKTFHEHVIHISIFIITKEFVINGGFADARVIAAGLGAGLPLVADVADLADVADVANVDDVVLFVADVVVLLLDDVDLADKFAPCNEKFKLFSFCQSKTKGLLFSKGLFDVIVSTKRKARISDLTSKKRSDQKIKPLCKTN